MNYYDILEVENKATMSEIKMAYRRLAKKYHPDMNPNNNTQKKFQNINEAYSILSDTKKRTEYDASQKTNFSYNHHNTPKSSQNPEWRQNDVKWAQDFYKKHTKEKKDKSQHTDGKANISISLMDSFYGTVQSVKTSVRIDCPVCEKDTYENKTVYCSFCNGIGIMKNIFGQKIYCPHCNGTGVEKVIKVKTNKREFCKDCNSYRGIKKEINFSVTIPKGVKDGETFLVDVKGNVIALKIKIKKNPGMERDGDDLYMDRKIMKSRAIKGTTITLKGIDGKIKLKIPPGSSNGQIFRLRGKGMPDNNGNRGNLFVKLKVI